MNDILSIQLEPQKTLQGKVQLFVHLDSPGWDVK